VFCDGFVGGWLELQDVTLPSPTFTHTSIHPSPPQTNQQTTDQPTNQTTTYHPPLPKQTHPSLTTQVSRLEEAPARDVKVTTTIFALTNVGEIAQRLHKKILESPQEKVFWVLPCIDNEGTASGGGGSGRRGAGAGEKGEEGGGGGGGSVMSVVHRYEALVELMGEERVRMVHGRMDGEAKLKALQVCVRVCGAS
jgi:hypothetical protein